MWRIFSVAMEKEKILDVNDISLSDWIKIIEYIQKAIEKQYEEQLNIKECFPSFETMTKHLSYKKVIECKNCIHRPIAIDGYTVTIPWQGDQLDLTCPYIRLDDCIMPDDNFYCAFGEKDVER